MRRIVPNRKMKRKHHRSPVQLNNDFSLPTTVDPSKLPDIINTMQVTKIGDITVFCPAAIIQAIAKNSAPIGIEIKSLNKFIFIDCDEVTIDNINDLS